LINVTQIVDGFSEKTFSQISLLKDFSRMKHYEQKELQQLVTKCTYSFVRKYN